MILAMFLNLKALERYVTFRKAWWAKPLAFLAYWGVAGTIIFVGDWGNLPYSIAAFFIGMLLAGGDGVLKTVTVCVMFSSLTFAYNAWIDSFFGAVLEELPFDFYAPSRLFFAAVLFLVTKYFAPEKDYELSPALWKLLLEVSLIPIGIVVVVVLGSPVDTNRIPNPTMYVILLFLAMAAFLGLLGMVSALARQRKLEQQSMFAEMNQAYYEAMEQQHFEIRRLRHDMANHLQALAGLSDLYPGNARGQCDGAYIELLRRRDGQCGFDIQRSDDASKRDMPGLETGYTGHIAVSESGCLRIICKCSGQRGRGMRSIPKKCEISGREMCGWRMCGRKTDGDAGCQIPKRNACSFGKKSDGRNGKF